MTKRLAEMAELLEGIYEAETAAAASFRPRRALGFGREKGVEM